MAKASGQLLIRQLEQARGEIESLKQSNETLQQEIRVLRLKVDALARRLFGSSSEKLNAAQLELVFAALQDDAPPPAQRDNSEEPAAVNTAQEDNGQQSKPRPKRKLEDVIASLPVTEVIIDPQEVLAEPEKWHCIGAEETNLIDFTPGKFSRQHIVRRKFVRKDQRHLPPVTAPLHTLQERCTATPALLAHTMTLRYEMHLPFYRIEKMYERMGVPISRQTLCNWSGMSAEASRLVTDAIKAEIFADGYVQIDETPVKYQDALRDGVCGTGWLWVIYNPMRNLCLFVWRLGRGAKDLQAIVPAEFEGRIQCDGHGAYQAFVQTPERRAKIALAGCLAHARRKFFEAKAEGDDPQWVLGQMQQIYLIEARAAEARAGPLELLEIRQRESRPIMQKIYTQLEEWKGQRKHLPRSLTGEAITYALNQWKRLEVFLEDGRLRVDNNLVENTIRPSAIGKKNWLFMGDPTSGDRAATFYTLIGNCHRAGADANVYLTDLFTLLPTATNKTVHQLTPAAWAAEQAAKRQALAQAASSAVLG